ncbi:hypothetical protein ACFLT1_07175 [Bacteroidota bacterium]
MRAFYNILAILLFLGATAFLPQDGSDEVLECASKAGPSAIYLKDFQVSLPAAEAGVKPPMYRQAVVLRGNSIYSFNVCNKQGEAVIRIYDSSRMILSSFDEETKQGKNQILLSCKKTGPYNIVITFKDGNAGEAIGIMSNMQLKK